MIEWEPLTCPNGFQKMENEGHEFCYKAGKVTYQQSKDLCESNGLGLVEIDSEAKAVALNSIASKWSYPTWFWFGLVCPTKTNSCNTNLNLWQWERSKKMLSATSGYKKRLYLSSGSIYGGGNGEHCIHWWGYNADNWAPQPCSNPTHMNTLCERAM